MVSEPGRRRASIAVGLVLILVGAAFLLGRSVEIDIGWPIWVIGPGLVIFILAFVVGGPGGAGFAVAGAVVTTVGVILAVQEATGTYASWAYAWALVAPGGVGLGLLVYGLWSRDREMARGGFTAMVTGAVIFLVGFAFLEGAVKLNDLSGPVTDLVVPAILVALGALLVVVALLPPGARTAWRGDASWGASGAAGATTAEPAAGGATGGGVTGAGAAGAATGAAAAGAGAAGAGAAGTPVGGRVETLDLPLPAGAADATVEIAFGAGRLEIGPALPGRLVDGEYDGGVIVRQKGVNHVRLSPPERWTLRLDRAPFDWLVGLPGEVPVHLSLEVGAADVTADLEALRVPDLRIRSGAAQVRVNLPRSGVTRVDAEGGAASLSFGIPPGVSARIRSSVALGSVAVDEARFPRRSGGSWASADADTATDRVELEVRGGVGSISIG